MNLQLQGEIARKLLKHKLQKDGIHKFAPNEFRREIGNVAKAIGVEERVLMEFAEILVRELVDEAFPLKK
jgi:hypothetical protein